MRSGIGRLATGLLWLSAWACGGEEQGAVVAAGSASPVESGAAATSVLESPLGAANPGKGERVSSEPLVDELPPTVRDSKLEAELRKIIGKYVAQAGKLSGNKASSRSVNVAVHVREEGRRGELVSISASRPQPTASNMKLVTSAAALCLLGPDFRFHTRFAADGPIENGVLEGDLVVFAAGDPLYDREGSGNVDAWLKPLAAKLRESGIQRIAGDVVLDEGTFELPGPAPGWPSSSQFWQDYCAFSGGFSANAGCVTATVKPRSNGQKASVLVEPKDHGLPSKIDVTTGKRKSQLTVVVGANTGRVIVRGKIAEGARTMIESFSHPDPVELFGAVLTGALEREGIQVAGEVVRERNRTRPGQRDLAILESSLLDTLVPINTDSNNSVTEQVLLALGNAVLGEGTREGGARAVRLGLERLGVSAEGFEQIDGSGLSRHNRVSAGQLTALIDAALGAGDAASLAFRDSLAVGGETGTLDGRLKAPETRGRVFAKTGWISGVSALSGIVLDGQERELIFSILVEYPRVSGLNRSCWKPMQDEICEVLAVHGG